MAAKLSNHDHADHHGYGGHGRWWLLFDGPFTVKKNKKTIKVLLFVVNLWVLFLFHEVKNHGFQSEKKQWVNNDDDDVTLPKYKISMFIILYFQKLPAFSNGEEEVSYIQLISSPIYLEVLFDLI